MEGVRQRKRENVILFEDERKDSSRKQINNDLPTSASIIIVILLLAFVQAIFVLNRQLPDALKIEDEEKYPDRFIAERAEQDLAKLVAFGTRVQGSHACEVLAVRLLRQQIDDIAQAANPVHVIQQDHQRPKGTFNLAFKPFGFQSLYEKLQNIVIRVGPKPPSNHSILVNCHFDTVPDSPGASDNGVNCVVMLEILRKLTKSAVPLKHNIIFLFNGAEENMLQAAHGFIAEHKWRKEVRVVVNLDAGGAGGRELLFQASPDHAWLVKAFAQAAPRPHGTSVGQDIFDSGIIPSDTDFRIFRDFGPVPGLDLAHAENGYIYHTRLDNMDYIAPGVYQHTGDNILNLLRHLAQGPEISNIEAVKNTKGKIVFFSIFGKYMIVLSQSTATVIHIAAALLTIYTGWKILRMIPKYQMQPTSAVLKTTSLAFVSVILGLITDVLIATVIDWAGLTMTWYRRPYLIVPLYVFPYVAAALVPWTFSKSLGCEKALEYFCGGQTLLAFTLLLSSVYGLRSGYLFTLVIIFPSIVNLLTSNIKSVKLLLLGLACTSLIGVAQFLDTSATFFYILIPITARFNISLNPDLLVALMTVANCLVVSNSLIPFLLAFKNPRNIIRGLAAVHLIALGLIAFTPLGFPYSGNLQSPALQRFYIYHTNQLAYNLDGSVARNQSGVVILPMDRNGMKYVSAASPDINKARPINCDTGTFCQFPLYSSRFIRQAKTSFYIPSPSPQINHATTLELIKKTTTGPSGRRYIFKLQGPDHLALVITMKPGISLINWSLAPSAAPVNYDNKLFYVVYLTTGSVGEPRIFSLDLEAEREVEGAWIDVSAIGHYQHHKATYIPEFSKLLNEFPEWTQATAWITQVVDHSF